MSDPAPTIPAGETPNQAIPIDTDTTSDSDDGGMQLDLPEQFLHLPPLENWVSGELYDNQTFGSDSEAQLHMSHKATLRNDTKSRNRIREEKNTALAVLTSWELLMTYALANGESIPMTRRRFTAKLLAPCDAAKQDELVAERWLVNTEDGLQLVPGRRRLIVDFDDDSGWRGPRKPRSASLREASASASMSTSRSNEASSESVRKGMNSSLRGDVLNSPLQLQQHSSSLQQSRAMRERQRERERERRRAWSHGEMM